RRNILGYTGMFWFQDGTLRFRPYENEKGWDGWMPRADRQRDIGPCPKCPPGHEAHRERYGQYYAMLPLGGWHSSYKYPHNQDGGVYEVGRIGSLGAGWRVGFVGLAPDGNDLLVTVTDPTGSSTSCSLRRAFTILQIADQLTPKVGLAGIFGAIISSAFGGGRKSVTLGDVFAAMDDELRGAMRDNDAAREEIATARADLSRRDRHKGRRQSAGART
ncbi:MAG: hypothetical protein Q8R16_00095, partial [bacterium]|nr:hypothetical protein [bacterium]